MTAAFEACAVGGLVVLSTCSLNPIENEQVIRNVLFKHHQYRKKQRATSDNEDDDDAFDIVLEDAHETATKNGCTLTMRSGLSGSNRQQK